MNNFTIFSQITALLTAREWEKKTILPKINKLRQEQKQVYKATRKCQIYLSRTAPKLPIYINELYNSTTSSIENQGAILCR